MSVARYTWPIPPAATIASTRYGPRWDPGSSSNSSSTSAAISSIGSSSSSRFTVLREQGLDFSPKLLVHVLCSQKRRTFARVLLCDERIELRDALPAVGIHRELR
jgi:hypothetical protein